MEILRQKLLSLWANYGIHHVSAVVVKGVVGLVILGGVSAPIVTTTIIHKKPVIKPVVVQKASHKVAAAPKPKPAAPPPAQAAPTPAPTPTPTQVATPQPKTLPATAPPPGSGAKSLAPVTASGGSSGSGSSSSPPAATGGYTSTNWSGYVATAGGYTGISGSWNVPTVSGNGSTTTADSAWIGIGGVFSGDLIQTGTEDTVLANSTNATYPFYELLPGAAILIPSMTVSAGDSMSASIVELSAGSWKITISDVSTGQSYTTTVAYSSSLSTAEWIEEDPSYLNGSLVPFDTFGSTVFSGSSATTGGSSSNIAGLNGQPITMVNGVGHPIAIPSILTGGGSGFTVTQN